ncbi:Isochorismatase [Propionispora sp. 2/2-37]|uniref:isochorismatase family protein n=1 Tax=Propionispora sp. 2/2-37 TaxID=1677858 RepID=UPI0006BB9955|nr:isochorismatase family protein [Propionispora sp. 2/2-37]CUH95314.1 Isochorismatase [Propionispora sp. 2/2-37]
MAIPAILPYSLAFAAELPQNRVSWKAEADRSVLLIHDMQQYFLAAYQSENSPLAELLRNIQLLKKQCKELGIPVIYTVQPGAQKPEDRALLRDFWGPGLADEPEQTKIADAIAPDDQDIVLTKWRYSAFKRTRLLEIMRGQGRDQLIICGVYAHIGCLLTAGDAFMQDLETFFVGDAVADFSLDHHRIAINYAAGCCSFVTSTELVLSQLTDNRSFFGVVEDNSTQPLTLQRVRKQVAELLGETAADLTDHESLVDRGLDSIRMMSLVEQWRRISTDITFIKLAKEPTIYSWWELLSAKK